MVKSVDILNCLIFQYSIPVFEPKFMRNSMTHTPHLGNKTAMSFLAEFSDPGSPWKFRVQKEAFVQILSRHNAVGRLKLAGCFSSFSKKKRQWAPP